MAGAARARARGPRVRREPDPLTYEDFRIWSAVCWCGFGKPVCNYQASRDADRRDAELMLGATLARKMQSLEGTRGVIYAFASPGRDKILCGWLQPFPWAGSKGSRQ